MFPNVRHWSDGRIARRFLPLILAFFLLLIGQPALVWAQTTPVPNPDLTARCGLDIVLAIDESGSFQGFESTMRYGVRALLDLVADTGSRCGPG